MRSVDRIRIAAGTAAVVAALAWILPSLGAKPAPMPPTMAAGGHDEPEAPRIYFKAPVTAEAAAVWIALQKKVPVKFPDEIPFEDFLKFVKESTIDKDNPDGVMIYVDPVGLQEALKTMSSPITLNLGTVRLETALKFVLEQLELQFSVHPDGIVYMTSKAARDSGIDDPNALILDRLDALQKQVAELRGLVAPPAHAHPAPAGGEKK